MPLDQNIIGYFLEYYSQVAQVIETWVNNEMLPYVVGVERSLELERIERDQQLGFPERGEEKESSEVDHNKPLDPPSSLPAQEREYSLLGLLDTSLFSLVTIHL